MEPAPPALAGCSRYHETSREVPPAAAAAKLRQSFPTLCDPIDGSPTGSPVPGILFSKFADILSAALSQHHLSGFEISQLKFHHLH